LPHPETSLTQDNDLAVIVRALGLTALFPIVLFLFQVETPGKFFFALVADLFGSNFQSGIILIASFGQPVTQRPHPRQKSALKRISLFSI
jgi:hypothetical protein